MDFSFFAFIIVGIIFVLYGISCLRYFKEVRKSDEEIVVRGARSLHFFSLKFGFAKSEMGTRVQRKWIWYGVVTILFGLACIIYGLLSVIEEMLVL